MRTAQKYLSVATTGIAVALLTTATPAVAQEGDGDPIAQYEELLSGEGYEGATCVAPTIEDNEVVVPAAPDSQALLIAFLAADVGEDTPYADLARPLSEGDRLSIVNADSVKQSLTEAVVCSAPAELVGNVADDLQGNAGTRPYSIATNGEASDGSDPESANPVVETDVPVDDSDTSAMWLSAGVLFAGAGGLAWSRKRSAPQG